MGANFTTNVETENPPGRSWPGVEEFHLKRGNQKLASPNDGKYAKVGQNTELHCALENRLHGYIVVHQQLNRLQIGYTPVTPVTSLSINNLISNIGFLAVFSGIQVQAGHYQLFDPGRFGGFRVDFLDGEDCTLSH
jgi:hypothetical protein